MPFRLVPLGEGPVISIDRPIVLIGRHADCDVRIDSKKASRRHCVVVQLHDRLVIRDLGSTNGITINNERVSEATLAVDQELSIANLGYRVVFEAAQAMAQTTPEAPKFERIAPLGPVNSLGFEVLFTKVSGPGNLENVSSIRLKGDEKKTVGKGDNCDIRITGDEKIDTIQCDLSLAGSDVHLTNRGAANNLHLQGGNTLFANLVQGFEYDLQIGDTHFKLIINN